MSNATWAEIVWSVGAFIGLNCNLALLRVAVLDIYRLRRHKLNGIRMLIAKGNRRNEVFRVFIQVALLYFGVVALLTPPNGGTSSNVSALGIVLTIVLVTVEALLVLGAVLDLRERRKLISMADKLEEPREPHR